MDFKNELSEHTKSVESIITGFLPEELGLQKTVIEAMRYSFLAGGKRLRPMLMQETYRLFDGSGVDVEPFMAALEMIHTYSLIHDDLPAMDDDEYRRGRKTTHIVYGEAMAILAGDGLLNFAFETAANAVAQSSDPGRSAQAMLILANRSGIYGMLGGQVVDVENEGLPVDKEKLDFIYELKTGALIESAMLIGAVLAGAKEEEQHIISEIAKNVGIAFQIQDDILDVIGDQAVLGKPIGSDEKNEKTTYVTLRGLDQAKADVASLSEQAISMLDQLPYDNPFLRELLISLIHRNK